MEDNKMHYFSNSSDKQLYMFRTDRLTVHHQESTGMFTVWQTLNVLVRQIPVAVNTVLRLLIMDSKSVRNM